MEIQTSKTIVTYASVPPISQAFRKDLLSMPIFGWDSRKILELIKFMERRISSKEFKKFPNTRHELNMTLSTLMELYELAKQEESQEKAKTSKAKGLFYRPRFDSKADTEIYGRLERRSVCSKIDRRNHEIQ